MAIVRFDDGYGVADCHIGYIDDHMQTGRRKLVIHLIPLLRETSVGEARRHVCALGVSHRAICDSQPLWLRGSND
jgi:hypothetical protein